MISRWLALAVSMLVVGCEGAPARSKPWRHASNSEVVEAPSALATAIASEAERAEFHLGAANTLRVHMDAIPGHLHPRHKPTRWGGRILMNTVFEPVIHYRRPSAKDDGGPGEYAPSVAMSWIVSADRRQVDLTIAEGRRFQDGRAVTSVDLQYSIDLARAPRGGAEQLRSMLSDVRTVEITSSRSVRVRLNKPNGYLLRALAALPVLPAHIYQGQAGRAKIHPVGSGPYRVESVEPDEVVLAAWEGYPGEKPGIPRVVFRYEPDAAVAVSAAKRGERDIIPALIPSHYPEQAQAPGVLARFEELRLGEASFRYLVLNHAESPFDDVRVRRALAHLIDRDRLVREAHHGLAVAAPGPVWPGGPIDGAAPAPPVHDANAAARLLDDSGWVKDGAGIRRRGGERLKLDVLVTEAFDSERDIVLAMLRAAGIATEVRVGSSAVLLNRLRDGAFDLAFMKATGISDRDLRPLLESGGRYNFGRIQDPVLDQRLERLAQQYNPRERAALAGAVAERIASQWPIVPLTRPLPYGLVSRRVEGVRPWNGWFSLRDLRLSASDSDE